jgi:carbon-monoxide dehydrogenase medium subunit
MIEDYIRAETLEEALNLLEKNKGQALIIAGGTDLLLKHNRNVSSEIVLIDISAIPELVEISSTKESLRIGAACTFAAIEKSPLLTDTLNVLSASASAVGSPQVRNIATIGGNLCNAAPSADSAPPLLVLDAHLEIASAKERRQVPLTSFFTAPGQIALIADELLTAIVVPPQPPDARAVYLRNSPRRALDLAIVGVAVKLWVADGKFQGRIALGAVAPTPLRAVQAEALLASNQSSDDDTLMTVAKCAAEEAAPISDVRATAEYRREMVEVLTFRALKQANVQLQQEN